MRRLQLLLLAVGCAAGHVVAAPVAAVPSDLVSLRSAFAKPPGDARIMMRWWWFGAAVQEAELERELKVMKAAGVGGVEIQPVYPLELDDPKQGIKNLPYLSSDFLKAISFVSEMTAKLGMRMDVTLGSGWPFGGPHTPVTEAAGRLRIERVAVAKGSTSQPLPALENGEKLLAIYLAKGERRQFSAAGARKLEDVTDGRVRLPQDTVDSVLLFFIASRTGQQVKRAAVGAEGYVLDHYDADAISHHLKSVAEPILQSFGNAHPFSIFSDSLEVFSSDWTPNLLNVFRQRRSYNLEDHWMALVADDDPDARSVRHDWGKTLTELVETNYLRPIRDWAHAHGTKFRSQTYGEPAAILSSNDLVDLPEGEAGPRWRTFNTARWAASASHIYGRPVTSSETWTWLHSPAFRATPLDMKAEADLHFLQGINQLVGHGWPYSPEHVGEPGWRFYAAAVFNEHNPWFQVMPEITSYLQRVSFLLRQGQAANDIAVYLPTDDAWANFRPGKVSVDRQMETLLGPDLIPQILDAGYNFDLLDDRALDHLLSSWKAIIVPGVERMPLETVKRLNDFARKGGKVIATRRVPSLAPGLKEAQSDSAQIAQMAKSFLFIEKEKGLSDALHAGLQPDLTFGTTGSAAVGFVHRKMGEADIYFVANTSNHLLSDEFSFRTSQSACELWDPFSGETHPIALKRMRDRAGVTLNLAPYESQVFVFTNSLPNPAKQVLPATRSIVMDGEWKVTFPKINKTSVMPILKSWSEDEATQFYSGEADYEYLVTVPAGVRKVFLDFGPGKTVEPSGPANAPGMRALLESPVRESAVVFVNDRRAGAVWHPPYELEIGALLHPGPNQLKIIVANTAINEISGSSLPAYRLLNLRFGERFTPQGFDNISPLPSGILGPVKLRLEQ